MVEDDSPVFVSLAGWLTHLNFFNEAQIHWLLKEIKPEVTGSNSAFHKLAVADSRYVSTNCNPTLYDLDEMSIIKDNQEIHQVVNNTITLIVLNYHALTLRQPECL